MLPLQAFAQQTGISGKVVDAQGGLIPGAKIVATKAGGATFNATTNAEGTFVLPSLVAGDYSITVSASGFATVEKKLLLLVGQLASVDITLPIASASSTVIVESSDTLAIDTTSSVVAGNVTPKEVEDIPVNGRNYVQLSALVPGIKSNSFGNTPAASGQSTNAGDAETGKFQITMDGLQVSQDSVGSSFGQPHFSQDAISQFQIITNRFDATSGRSAGIYVNVQTKTGTNAMHGGGFGYFRNSFFNASDPITKVVNSFADEQYGGTIGGAIKKDKFWYFGSYEGEHQPNTASTSPYITTTPGIVNGVFSHPTIVNNNEYLGRLDYQRNDKNHFFLRGDAFTSSTSYFAGADPSQSYSSSVSSSGYVFDWNHNINDHLINDVHTGFHYFQFQNLPFFATNSIQIALPAVTVGEPYNEPEIFDQYTQQYRDDLFWSKGKHSVRLGGEYLYTLHAGEFPQYLRGGLTCTSSVTASPSLYNSFFPTGTLDPTNWNYSLINNYCASTGYTQAFGQYNISITRNAIGVWAQDDWKILPRLTLNLGIRYDNDIGAYNTGYVPTPGLLTPNTNPNANFAPRLGFAYDPGGDGKTSIRGGAGLYFADQVANPIIDEELYSSTARALQATTSGNPTNPIALPTPFAGQTPSANPTGYVTAPQPVARGSKTPYAFQASFGIARELPFRTTMTADFVHMRVYDDFILLAANLLVNPASPETNLTPSTAISAANYATRFCGNGDIELDTVSNLATGAPANGVVNGASAKQVCNNLFSGTTRTFTTYPGAGAIADALQVGLKHATTKGFTGAIAYTWGRTKNSTGGQFSYPNKPFRSGIQQEWADGTDDQRHTLTVNGEYQWKYGLSLSSLYHFGSGLAFATSSGSSVNGYTGSTRTFGAGVTPVALGFTGTCPTTTCQTVYAPLSKISYDAGYGYYVIQRDGFRGTDYNRVDARLQENFKIKERYHAIVAMEAFNLFNHSNYGNFAATATTGTGTNAYGHPTASSGAPFEYQARSLQFIGRFSF
jgi:Carboxypeptidase regulatory-like domain/TonB dependent receptor